MRRGSAPDSSLGSTHQSLELHSLHRSPAPATLGTWTPRQSSSSTSGRSTPSSSRAASANSTSSPSCCPAPRRSPKSRPYKPLGIILSGGPSSVYDADAPAADPALLELGVPILGICYGLQFIVHHLGGKVKSAPLREYGHAEVTIEDAATPLFAGLPRIHRRSG